MSRVAPARLPLTPEHFPSVFTDIPVEQLRQMPSVNTADLIPKRYYLYIGMHDTLEIIYICKNYPRIGEFVFQRVYHRLSIFGNRWMETDTPGTNRLRYADFGSSWYDLAAGFGNAIGTVQLDPDSVELLPCDREPGPRERRLRTMLFDEHFFIGGRRTRHHKLRRRAKIEKTRRQRM
jgi:hypothetical protein